MKFAFQYSDGKSQIIDMSDCTTIGQAINAHCGSNDAGLDSVRIVKDGWFRSLVDHLQSIGEHMIAAGEATAGTLIDEAKDLRKDIDGTAAKLEAAAGIKAQAAALDELDVATQAQQQQADKLDNVGNEDAGTKGLPEGAPGLEAAAGTLAPPPALEGANAAAAGDAASTVGQEHAPG